MPDQPNILLVHGAWGDALHWSKVIPVLQQAGHLVYAVENPLTSLEDDIARTRTLAESLDGPTLLVGHSYGGAVISGAGHAENVAGLVYIAAFAPDEGETINEIFGRTAPPAGAANIAPDAEGFLWIAQDKFRESFCQDLDPVEAAVFAAAQKPIHGSTFGAVPGPAAWKAKPSWYQVSANDRMIPPDTERAMAERMDPRKTIELEASHASMASHPAEVAELVLTAARSL